MSGESGYIYSDECVKLHKLAATYEVRIEETLRNKDKAHSLDAQIEENGRLVEGLEIVRRRIKPWMDDLLEYNAQKKKEALLSINTALSVANFIVPSSMKGIRFKIEGKEAWIENEAGMDVHRTEGSGYKGVVSAYLRSVVLKSNPDLLQFIIFDEPLAKLSTENSVTFSNYLPILAENMQLIWIEQKKEVFANVDNKVVYTFFKDDTGHTLALKEM